MKRCSLHPSYEADNCPVPFHDLQNYRGYQILHNPDKSQWQIRRDGQLIDVGKTLRTNPFEIVDAWLKAV